MRVPVTKHGLAWDPQLRRGEVSIFAGSRWLRISAGSPEEFAALASILDKPHVIWDGGRLWTEIAGFLLSQDVSAPVVSTSDSESSTVIDVCEEEWAANKGDCSAFVKDVAARFGVKLSGNANAIVDHIRGEDWERIGSGSGANDAAQAGMLVICGMRGDEQADPGEHGHVVIVVDGPLAKGKYPSAYWGKLGGIGERNKNINWAWRVGDRDRLTYAGRAIGLTCSDAQHRPGSEKVNVSTDWSLEHFDTGVRQFEIAIAFSDLDLAEAAKSAASILKEAHSAVVFTSGRRDVPRQAAAMAQNIVRNRKWIEQTYKKTNERDALQAWIDANSSATTEAQIAAGLAQIMACWSDEQKSKFSSHFAGLAFDVRPVPGKEGEKIKDTIRKLPHLCKFLDSEGGLEIWHAEFESAQVTL